MHGRTDRHLTGFISHLGIEMTKNAVNADTATLHAQDTAE